MQLQNFRTVIADFRMCSKKMNRKGAFFIRIKGTKLAFLKTNGYKINLPENLLVQLLQKKNTNEKISLNKGVTCADKNTSGLSSRVECNVKKPKVFHDPQNCSEG